MPIDPTDLAKSIGALGCLDPQRGVARTLQQLTDAAKQLFRADAAGLMLIDAGGSCAGPAPRTRPPRPSRTARSAWPSARVRWRSASGSRRRSATSTPNPAGRNSRRSWSANRCSRRVSVPVELDGGVMGTLDVYVGQPRDWDPSEVAALQACAGLVASLLSAAVTAQVKGRLADRLQAALEHRWLIEQAKGVLMGREQVDAQTAFERLRGAARTSTRRLADVARDVTAGQPPPDQPS
jgi:hypothetical protein